MKPEDVRLDVEAIEDDLITIGRRILNAIEKHSLPDGANDEIEAAVHDLNRVLALLRRVSGKGAQGPGPKVQACGWPMGSSGYLEIYCSRESGHSGIHQCFTTPVPVPSPAPVPATPKKEK